MCVLLAFLRSSVGLLVYFEVRGCGGQCEEGGA